MGLITHEAPRLTGEGPVPYPADDADRPLEAGMVVSIETTLPHPKRGYVKLEDTVAVTAGRLRSFRRQRQRVEPRQAELINSSCRRARSIQSACGRNRDGERESSLDDPRSPPFNPIEECKTPWRVALPQPIVDSGQFGIDKPSR